MSTRFSPDGMYYWDGATWISTLSPDGRYRWDGAAWQPTGSPGSRIASNLAPYEPTAWTVRLQVAVIAFFAAQLLWAASLPFWFIDTMTNWANAMNAQIGSSGPPPPDVAAAAASADAQARVQFYLLVAIAIAVALVAIVAAIRRSRAWYSVILGLLGVEAAWSVLVIAGAVLPSVVSGGPPPIPVLAPAVALLVFGGGLFVWTLVAAQRNGPWAMRRS